MDPIEVVRRAGGVVRRTDLLGAGASRASIDKAISGGVLLVPARGVLVWKGASRDRRTAAACHARLTCVSACAEAGLPVLGRDPGLHLAVRRSYPRREAADHVRHYAADVGRDLAPMPITRALDHTGVCLEPRRQLVLLDAALRRGMIVGADLDRWTRTTNERRAWLLRHSDPRAESPLETLTRVDLVEAGLTVEPQAWIDGVGRVDLLVEGRAVVELDGRGFHDSDDAFVADRRRDRELARRGYLPLRFAYADVIAARPGELARVCAEALAARRRRPVRSGAG